MKLGRTFNHLEDLVFFYGVAGALEALEHLEEVSSSEYTSLRMKWDGSPQIYWGRKEINGPLVLATHNSWSKNVETFSKEEIKHFILTTGEFSPERVGFANNFANLYELFDAATPNNFVGFVYADAMYLSTPDSINGVFSFSPNPYSDTSYHVNEQSELGKRVAASEVMVVGHAYYNSFGQSEELQQPIDDFTMFESTKLIVLGPVYNQSAIVINHNSILDLKLVAKTSNIDSFLEKRKGLADLKDILYKYMNSSAKLKQLSYVSPSHFKNWVDNGTLSSAKKSKLAELVTNYLGEVQTMFDLILGIMHIKNSIISQLQPHNEIWDTNGEGRVRYTTKPLGHVKFVPRHLWTPK